MVRRAALVATMTATAIVSSPAYGQSPADRNPDTHSNGPATNSALDIQRVRHERVSDTPSSDELAGPPHTGLDATEAPAPPNEGSAVVDEPAGRQPAQPVEADGGPESEAAFEQRPTSESRPLGADTGPLNLGQARAEHDSGDDQLPGIPEFGRVAGSLAVVIGLLVLLTFLAKRFGSGRFAAGAGRPGGILQILARYPVARGQSLVLLKLDRRILLVHQTGSAMTTLTELTDINDVASLLARIEASERGGLGATFQRALSRAGETYRSGRSDIETIDLTRPDQARLLRTSMGRKQITA